MSPLPPRYDCIFAPLCVDYNIISLTSAPSYVSDQLPHPHPPFPLPSLISSTPSSLQFLKTEYKSPSIVGGLKIAILNCRSLLPKLPLLTIFIQFHSVDILFLTETWLCASSVSSAVTIPGFQVFRRDRLRGRGGGVIILIKDSFSSCEIDLINLSLPVSDLCCVDMIIDFKVFRFICVYRPQAAVIIERDDILQLCSAIKDLFRNNLFFFVVAGDLNLPDINWVSKIAPSDGVQDLFLNFLINHSLCQVVFSLLGVVILWICSLLAH